MMKTNAWNPGHRSDNNGSLFSFWHFLSFAALITACLGGIGWGLLSGGILGNIGLYVMVSIIGTAVMIIMLILKQDELAITAVVAVHLYVDWYLGLGFVALIMMLLLLIFYYMFRTSHIFLENRNTLWIWFLLLLMAVIPATRGINLLDEAYYYANVILGAFMMFSLGTVIGCNDIHIIKLFNLLSLFAVLIAIIVMIQTTTGDLLFGSTRYDAYFAQIGGYYALSSDTSVQRIGGFFINPNSGGGFFAMMLLIPLGLFWESSTWRGKLLYFSEIFILLPALIFSFSTESWLSLCVGVVVFLIFIGRTNYRLFFLFIIVSVAIIIVTVFPSQIVLQLQHAEDPSELPLRSGAWQTGIQVIRAFPLFGLGLGRYVYFVRAEPYRAITQYSPLDHPHNAFLELAALGGLPVAIMFTFLLLLTFRLALHNWFRSSVKVRPLIASGVASAVALTIFSLSDAGWTCAPLLAVGWLLLGAVSMPIKSKS